MVVRVFEYGPFGCLIDRGTIERINEIPEGYEAKSVEKKSDYLVVYVEPKRGHS
jgi:hypothetical protein